MSGFIGYIGYMAPQGKGRAHERCVANRHSLHLQRLPPGVTRYTFDTCHALLPRTLRTSCTSRTSRTSRAHLHLPRGFHLSKLDRCGRAMGRRLPLAAVSTVSSVSWRRALAAAEITITLMETTISLISD